MQNGVLKALVLQGGGAVGAYELGAARVLYGKRPGYAPDLIAGVSIGAITATLLARPKSGNPLQTLEDFWKEVEVSSWVPVSWQRYASFLGNPKFFRGRWDFFNLLTWTSFYDLSPLRDTLRKFVSEDRLRDLQENPRLLITATNVRSGGIDLFDSAVTSLSLDHVLASSSVPGAFPPTRVGENDYWDGGIFDNTPLGYVIRRMDPPSGDEKQEIVIVNLFPNAATLPANLVEVGRRALNLLLSNKTESDLDLTQRFNTVAALLDKIKNDPQWSALAQSDEFKAANKNYLRVPEPITITQTRQITEVDPTDFSHEAIQARARDGEQAARDTLMSRGIKLTP